MKYATIDTHICSNYKKFSLLTLRQPKMPCAVWDGKKSRTRSKWYREKSSSLSCIVHCVRVCVSVPFFSSLRYCVCTLKTLNTTYYFLSEKLSSLFILLGEAREPCTGVDSDGSVRYGVCANHNNNNNHHHSNNKPFLCAKNFISVDIAHISMWDRGHCEHCAWLTEWVSLQEKKTVKPNRHVCNWERVWVCAWRWMCHSVCACEVQIQIVMKHFRYNFARRNSSIDCDTINSQFMHITHLLPLYLHMISIFIVFWLCNNTCGEQPNKTWRSHSPIVRKRTCWREWGQPLSTRRQRRIWIFETETEPKRCNQKQNIW